MKQTKKRWLVNWLVICFVAAPSITAAMQTQQKATFADSSGNEKKGFGAKDCEDTSKTLKVKVAKNAEKIKHYSIHKSSSSSTKNGGNLVCSSSETKSVNDLDAFSTSIILTQDVCNSTSGGKRDVLVCFWDETKKEVIADVRVTYDTVIPNAPDITELIEGEQEIKLIFKVDNKGSKDIDTANICYALVTDDVFEQEEEPCPEGASRSDGLSIKDNFVVVSDLENGSEYAFKIQVTDTSGNLSSWSKVARGTPVQLQTALGEASWPTNPFGINCSSFGLGAPMWLLWAFYRSYMQRRRRKKSKQTQASPGVPGYLHGLRCFCFINVLWIGFAAAVGLLLSCPPLQAAPGQISLGINASPYKPDMDRNLTTPVYSKFFGKSPDKGPWLPLLGIETNVHLFDGYGSIQLGPALSYTWASGYARKENGEESQVKLQLHLYQIRPQLTYVFDPYVHVIPLAPYVRAGFIAMGYVFTFDNRLDQHGQHPTGFVLGWDAAFGLLFMLDGLQPDVSLRAKATGRYRHVYLKAELSYAQIDNFGMGGPVLSPKGMFGLSIPLMATFGLLIQF